MTDKRRLYLLANLALALTVVYLTWGLKQSSWRYALSLRIPKTAAILVTGSAIAFSTVVFQTITANRILTPSIMGLDSLYLFVQTVILFFFGSQSGLHLSENINFLLSVGAMMLFAVLLYRLLFKRESEDIYFLLLVGVIMGTMFQSLAGFLQMVMDPNEFLILQGRMFASFNNVNTELLAFSFVIIGAVFFVSRRFYPVLDVLALGREQALNLGVDYDKLVQRMLITVAVLVSVATGLVGPITFLGLLVANLAREFLATYLHQYLIAASVLISIIALMGGQVLAERVFNFAAPISVIINLGGGMYFIYLLVRGNRA